MFYAIINTDNDTIARYDTEDEANTELAYYDDEHTVVEYFPYFHNIPSGRIAAYVESARQYARIGTLDARTQATAMASNLSTEFGLTFDQIFGN